MNDDEGLWTRLRDAADSQGKTGGTASRGGKLLNLGAGDFGAGDYDDGRRPRPPGFEPYLLDADLAAAAEIAIRLRQPLLLTGDPGTGKTRFAGALAHRLGMPLVTANIRSTTTTADLFYSVDDLRRFRDAHFGTSPSPFGLEHYISINALGRAILFAGGPETPLKRILTRTEPLHRKSDMIGAFSRLYPSGAFPAEHGCRVVVLLDEFDKAPRDTPNDMLNEIADMAFDVPELGLRVEAPKDMRPIVVITSNSERSLPDPFLRRCIYHDIQFPNDPTRLRAIVWSHLAEFREEKSLLLEEILETFVEIRKLRLTRRPGTAELLDWLRALVSPACGFSPFMSLREPTNAEDESTRLERLRHSLFAIVKAKDDIAAIDALVMKRLGAA